MRNQFKKSLHSELIWTFNDGQMTVEEQEIEDYLLSKSRHTDTSALIFLFEEDRQEMISSFDLIYETDLVL